MVRDVRPELADLSSRKPAEGSMSSRFPVSTGILKVMVPAESLDKKSPFLLGHRPGSNTRDLYSRSLRGYRRLFGHTMSYRSLGFPISISRQRPHPRVALP